MFAPLGMQMLVSPCPAPCSAPGTPQYATVARRLQGTAVYSELQRRPDGER